MIMASAFIIIILIILIIVAVRALISGPDTDMLQRVHERSTLFLLLIIITIDSIACSSYINTLKESNRC